MANRKGWTERELLVAFGLYCRLPFGKLHSGNTLIIRFAERIGRIPSALAMKLVNIASLDPAITSTGRKGLSGASLADKKMWEAMTSDWESFALQSEAAIREMMQNEEDIENLQATDQENYAGYDKEVMTKVRVGQNFFRRSVLSAYNYTCCISGLTIPDLLVASHIVPWRDDSSNRLNPKNGLALSALHDRAFDLGIITISEEMTVKVSKVEHAEDDYFFLSALKSFENKKIALPDKFAPADDFLDYHRENIFRG